MQPKIEKLYTVSTKKDQELTVAQIMNSLLQKFRLKLKKVGKITRPFRYNRIPYDYTVEVTNSQEIRSDRVSEEQWAEVHDIVQEEVTKTIPKKKCKRAK